jgi:hypothetical protein
MSICLLTGFAVPPVRLTVPDIAALHIDAIFRKLDVNQGALATVAVLKVTSVLAINL